jgi:hypothetical protein
MLTLDFFDSDQSYHLFCPDCRAEIPSWLIRYETSALCEGDCEGCERKRMGWGTQVATKDGITT